MAWWLASTNRWLTTGEDPQSDQTCPLQSLQRTKRNKIALLFSLWSCERLTSCLSVGRPLAQLLQFDRSSRFFKLLLNVVGFLFGNAFLDRLRRAVNQVLRFLQA